MNDNKPFSESIKSSNIKKTMTSFDFEKNKLDLKFSVQDK